MMRWTVMNRRRQRVRERGSIFGDEGRKGLSGEGDWAQTPDEGRRAEKATVERWLHWRANIRSEARCQPGSSGGGGGSARTEDGTNEADDAPKTFQSLLHPPSSSLKPSIDWGLRSSFGRWSALLLATAEAEASAAAGVLLYNSTADAVVSNHIYSNGIL